MHILDRFHIVAKTNDASDDVRAEEARALARDGKESILKKSRWCILKRPEHLTFTQKRRFKGRLRYNPISVRAYLLKEDFQQFWEHFSPTRGRQVPRCLVYRSPPLTHRAHEEDYPYVPAAPAAHLELVQGQRPDLERRRRGHEQQGQTDHQKMYSFRFLEILRMALLYTLGKLPEPDLTHQFR